MVTAAPVRAPERHCVVPVSDREARCFTSFRRALAEATTGRITDAPGNAAAAAADRALERRINTLAAERQRGDAPREGYVLSIEYQHENFGGSSVIFTGFQGCDGIDNGTIEFEFADLAPIGWNDTISSFRTYSNCRVSHFEHPHFVTPRTLFQTTLSYIGSLMNDRASSLQWT
ncbi:hypothetical protein ETD83_08510 [Actinomadura soli]|uniref:Uncharacterized protein n=1 Tax=Actinomadura soli TaxID=2508997 RepID=A0A5C4JI91_9ACTN|nr:hypothetical protein [Actinomadura soli]TMR04300.1 hypothetical protein ETD83_08510 [Actinomadura soli]